MGEKPIRVLLVEADGGDSVARGITCPGVLFELRRTASLSSTERDACLDNTDCVLFSSPRAPEALTGLLARQGRSFAVVVLVGEQSALSIDQALMLGADDVLGAPVSEALLGRAIAAAHLRTQLDVAQAARGAAEEASLMLGALADAGKALALAERPEQAMAAVGRAIVPALADACALDLLDDDGVLLRYSLDEEPLTIECEPAPPGLLVEALSAPSARLLCVPNETQLAQLLRGGEAPARPPVTRAALLVPLRFSGEPIGVLSLLAGEARGVFSYEAQGAAERLALMLSASLAGWRRERRMRDAVEARDHLTSIVSHDLRNPLFNVQMASDELITTAPEPCHRHIEIIRRGARLMNRLIQDLLDISRIESGKMTLERGRFDITGAVRDAVQAQAALAAQRSIDVQVEVPDALPRPLADRDRIAQAIGNLLQNAIKFSPQRQSVTVQVEQGEGELRVSVHDKGVGIPADKLPRLFDRFARGGEGRSTGLGLAIARGLVELHGGRIWVESQLGEGSSFAFSVPLDEQAA